ncbi:MAG TPA: hypothetical protein DEV73_03335 [Candidatus Zambryskibacteria bacterium]|uniref:Uncharacterized protein n=1 Tax=Candidatus Blackburnbacteria bacterium RIFCSPLOWO2_01_FULL_40_20 TaxID=1797519 RepID=A0A1G1VBA0_9BACT|nr:MAG: hypothetical protein A2694_02970 [Candidatus Blackburnbacteria bacterium RIFCSPHIGHO2_01_FULL_40_17]OGY09903.1 MAG: hypothetical protein A3D24_04350 [Candidatus Blackburnbacteria bacterium RIFCSPHIGHO2_02_FULL_39_13]OGY12512.1 MAG: hypothetical protein A3A77_00885 [Candidatus Blackburnbacteria bacterium RIFCSPLOWO2_01_FULL_40_20]OGY15801.1 MAG: hypothetical protein A3I52_03230 [Candidatus Blackburnbacteria bacterium RIFCSPLOWO2_02_FULL_40_10]HBL51978.1 hypothetical protein [Candidatus B
MKEWLKESWWLIVLFISWLIEPLRWVFYVTLFGFVTYLLLIKFHPGSRVKNLEKLFADNRKKVSDHFELVVKDGKYLKDRRRELQRRQIIEIENKLDYLFGLYIKIKAKVRHDKKMLTNVAEDLCEYSKYAVDESSRVLWNGPIEWDGYSFYNNYIVRSEESVKAEEIEKNFKELLKKTNN